MARVFRFFENATIHNGGPRAMTITKGDPAHPPSPVGRAATERATPPATRRSHVPNEGSAEAAAVERARKGMLH